MPTKADLQTRITKALQYAVRYGGTDGAHHLRWVLDQMVRALTGCPDVRVKAKDCNGRTYTCTAQGESDEYRTLVADACAGEDGPDTYEWDVGIPP